MGTYLNPGNGAFKDILKKTYIDKSGIIKLLNDNIETTYKLTCVSRPRRFGKSFTAKMLCAYYDCMCDSHELFCNLEIAEDKYYEKYLNKYNVIYLDMANIIEKTTPTRLIEFIKKSVASELFEAFPNLKEGSSFDSTLINAVSITNKRFFMIIDEWDAPIRETPEIEKEYLRFLRMLFKGSGTTDQIFAAVYMTGILPIKKDGSQSALSDFKEYSMVNPGIFAEFVGFTDKEVKALCKSNDVSYEEMKKWYDGYHLNDVGDIYNPNSVMEAIRNKYFTSYWTQSSAIDSLLHYISMDFDGLSKEIAALTGGSRVNVNVRKFDNDLKSFRNKDSVLTVLIHLGYLVYDRDCEEAYVPNEEIKIEFSDTIKDVNRDDTIKRVAESTKLIMDTVQMNEEAVAAQIERIHEDESAALFYNNEQALRGIIKLAYFAYKDYYIKLEELPAGAGYADIVYFPKKDTTLPALLIELKWDETAKGAIEQIKARDYPEVLKDYGGELLLVGINYDKNAKPGKRHHTCVIESFEG